MKNQEANRCLLCRQARCQQACPIHTPVPEIMKLYRADNLSEAGRILFDNNPLSAITAQVCDWDLQCYGHCVLNAKQQPVPFYQIEQEISEPYLLNYHPTRPALNGQSVAVVGGGPAGITVALRLAMRGYSVIIYEQDPRIGGILRYGIPSFRLDKKYVDAYERILHELGVTIRPNTPIGPVITLEKLLKDGRSAVFIGTGVGQPKMLNIPGETLGNAHYAIYYLHDPDIYDLGHRVIVIGAGNVAMDAARTAARHGCDTAIYYRKTFANMPASEREIADTKKDGVRFAVFEAPMEIRPHSMVFCKAENVTDENGRVKTRILAGTEHEVPCDSVIIAASQTADTGVVSGDTLMINGKGLLVSDNLGHTSMEGVFGSGDIVFGAGTVVAAVSGAKIAADSMDAYCRAKREAAK